MSRRVACPCGDWSSGDWIRDVVEFVVEVARGKESSFGSLNPASCASSFIFILWSVLGQIVS